MARHAWPAVLLCISVLASGTGGRAAEPPPLLDYQGVLRDAAGLPVDGARDMIFRFYDTDGGPACSDGTVLLSDAHEASDTGGVTVDRGLFHVALGSGWLTPGAEAALPAVFGNHTGVWLEVEVAGERLCPRIRVVASAFALNADQLEGMHASAFAPVAHAHTGGDVTGSVADSDRLDGQHAADFVNLSSAAQTKSGGFRANAGITGYGSAWGGHFGDADSSARAWIANGDDGLHAQGDYVGGYFVNTSSATRTWIATGGEGVLAIGATTGGYFSHATGSGVVWAASGNTGVQAKGSDAGGYFWDSNSSGIAWVGYGDQGLRGEGNAGGGYFKDRNGSGWAVVGYQDEGISAHGDVQGGYFECQSATGRAWIAQGDYGIHATGSVAGGRFNSLQVDGFASVDVIEIRGGTDLAEPFPVDDVSNVPSGAVLVIDHTFPGRLRLSDRAYDPRVAGVVSGAGGIEPGIILRPGEPRDDEVRLAMSGRVHVLATASNGPIRPGDLLTTSDLAGHAMRATARDRSAGAVLGKAMSALEEGRGLVLVLVSLQ